MKRILIYVLLLRLMENAAEAQPLPRLGVQDVLAALDRNYPSLQIYDSKIAALRSMAGGAKAWMPPTVAFALDRFPYRVSMLKEKIPDNQAGIMLSVQQMIPNPSRLNARKNYLASLEEVFRNDREWQKNVLHLAAKLYYYRRYTAEKKINIVREYEDLLRMLIKTGKDKYKYNQAELPVIFKAEALLGELANMETMFVSQVAECNIGLNTLMNRDAGFLIDTLLLPQDYGARYPATLDSAAFQRSDILAAESRIRSMRFSQKTAATGSKPEFGVQVTHGKMLGMPDQFSIMGMMTIPIAPWASKMYRSDVRSMGFEIEAMQSEKSTMQLMARQMIREKAAMLLAENRQLDNYDRNILPAYRKNLDASLLAWRQNTGSLFVLLDAWNMLLMKELERAEKLGQVFTMQSEFEYQSAIK
ncbi:hypothetical protein EGT74_12615 [Chitinophaga lutea]|uniref:TolC family protein n=1 Tax=Chitinophaga lutea TaxID=2488634 RepID=A0A3N4Q877_9BACT|nr:TolC family protein [Chitinophaga lutea]RPE07914.1 hypothetical protein EGT74_12615 [Chitinophaga lutea]